MSLKERICKTELIDAKLVGRKINKLIDKRLREEKRKKNMNAVEQNHLERKDLKKKNFHGK